MVAQGIDSIDKVISTVHHVIENLNLQFYRPIPNMAIPRRQRNKVTPSRRLLSKLVRRMTRTVFTLSNLRKEIKDENLLVQEIIKSSASLNDYFKQKYGFRLATRKGVISMTAVEAVRPEVIIRWSAELSRRKDDDSEHFIFPSKLAPFACFAHLFAHWLATTTNTIGKRIIKSGVPEIQMFDTIVVDLQFGFRSKSPLLPSISRANHTREHSSGWTANESTTMSIDMNKLVTQWSNDACNLQVTSWFGTQHSTEEDLQKWPKHWRRSRKTDD